MTNTSYKVVSVLNAYTKKNKIKISATVPKENVSEGKEDVFLSAKEDSRAEEYDIISSNIRDVILKDDGSSS
jgi:hypothetical protein